MQEENGRSEQSQVAEMVCKEKGIPYFVLRPSEARRLKSMRVLPGVQGDNASIVKRIRELLVINPALDLYRQLEESLSGPEARLTS